MSMAAKGLAKLAEELGELQAVVGKKLAYYTTNEHPDGAGPLDRRMEEEMGDVIAAISFTTLKFGLSKERIAERAKFKTMVFREWDKDPDNNQHGVDA